MQRRGFFGSLVLTMFSLPKVVQRVTMGEPANVPPSPTVTALGIPAWTGGHPMTGTRGIGDDL